MRWDGILYLGHVLPKVGGYLWFMVIKGIGIIDPLQAQDMFMERAGFINCSEFRGLLCMIHSCMHASSSIQSAVHHSNGLRIKPPNTHQPVVKTGADTKPL